MNKARETEEKRGVERRRAGLVLSIRFLLDNGYVAAARTAEEEAGISLSKIDVADNIDMASILQDYEEYVQLKFGRPVKLTRKVSGSGGGRGEGHLPNIAANAAAKMERRAGSGPRSKGTGRTRTPRDDNDAGGQERGMGNYAGIPGGGGGAPAGGGGPPGMGVGAAPGAGMGRPPKKNPQDERPVTPPPGMGVGGGFDVKVTRIERKPEGMGGSEPHNPDTFYEDRLLKPLHPLFGGDSGSRELANLISRDIISANPGVTWDDIAELQECKRLLKEAVVMPLKYPQVRPPLPPPTPPSLGSRKEIFGQWWAGSAAWRLGGAAAPCPPPSGLGPGPGGSGLAENTARSAHLELRARSPCRTFAT